MNDSTLLMKSRIVRVILKVVVGNTIIVSYTTRNDARYTWYINDNWIFFVTFIVSTSLFSLIKWKLEKRKSITNPRGGSLLEECVEYNKTYEIIDEDLKRIIRDLIKDTSIKALIKESFVSKKTLVITPFLLFLANVAKANPAVQIVKLGTEVIIEGIRRLIVGTSISVALSALIVVFIKTVIIRITFVVLLSAAALSLGARLQHVECTNLLRELPQISAPIEQTISPERQRQLYMLDVPKNQLQQTILMKDFEAWDESEIYVLEKLENEICTTQIDKSERISQKCNSEKLYQPLTEIRASKQDIRKWDSSDMLKKADVIQKNYEARQTKLDVPQSAIEGFTTSSRTRSNSAAESPLFRKPDRRSIPLNKRTKMFSTLVKETLEKANLDGYPYTSDDVSKSTPRPSGKIPEKVKVEEPKNQPKETTTTNSKSEEL